MEVLNLLYALSDNFGMLISLTWSGNLYKHIWEAEEVFVVILICYLLHRLCESESQTQSLFNSATKICAYEI